MLGVHRRGLVDDESVLEEFNALACDVWGKPSRTEVVPAFSPLGADARRGAVNISQLLAERERAVLDPDR